MSKRVAVVEFSHESNTFSVLTTGMENFLAGHYLVGQEIEQELGDTNSELGGYLAAVEEFGWEPVYTVAATATPGGPVSEDARCEICDEILTRLQNAGYLDGIFIALHGAMVTETSQDGETQFLKLVREAVGDAVPIAVTFDLHGNVFDELVEYVDIAVSYRTYPHIDMAETGRKACDLLERAMQGEIDPVLEIARPPMLVGCDDGRTTNNGPMCRLLETAAREAEQDGILSISINAGFTDADVFAAGPSVIVCYDKAVIEKKTPKQIAAKIVEQIWQWRDTYDLPIPLEQCLEQINIASPGKRPIVIADFSDNTGSGAYGDCTAIISALLDRGIKNAAVGAIWDPVAASQLAKLGTGAQATVQIGGKTDPATGGGPITVSGQVTSVSDGEFTYEGPMFAGLPGHLGSSVCLNVSGVDILIVSERLQVLDKNIFRTFNIEPADKSVVVVKSMQHFRAAFAPLARKIIVTDAGGLCTPNVANRIYKNIRRPIFPLDDTKQWAGELFVENENSKNHYV